MKILHSLIILLIVQQQREYNPINNLQIINLVVNVISLATKLN